MRARLFHWHESDFVSLAAEGDHGPAGAQVDQLLERMAAELSGWDLGLDDVVRSRLWARDRESRDAGSAQRFRILAGPARAASSSYIDPTHMAGPRASVALDLLAMRRPGHAPKVVVERDPPAGPARYVAVDRFRFLSGVTCPTGTLKAQVDDILPRIEASLTHAGTDWAGVIRATAILHREESIEELRRILAPSIGPDVLTIGFADGYSLPGKRLEVEVTAIA